MLYYNLMTKILRNINPYRENTMTATKKFDSKLLKDATFYPDTKVLDVTFKTNNEIYRYAGVPEKVYEGLVHAESKGGYFLKNIRDTYKFTKVSNDTTK